MNQPKGYAHHKKPPKLEAADHQATSPSAETTLVAPQMHGSNPSLHRDIEPHSESPYATAGDDSPALGFSSVEDARAFQKERRRFQEQHRNAVEQNSWLDESPHWAIWLFDFLLRKGAKLRQWLRVQLPGRLRP